MSPAKIKVLIVDDSRVVQQLLSEMLSKAPGIEVVGVAADPFQAREMIKTLAPDVITLDVEMPKMDGITFLSNLMRLRPMPVVMISTLTEKGADVTLQALELGAIDYVAKPKIDFADSLSDIASEIVRKIKVAARVNVSAIGSSVHKDLHAAKNRLPVGKSLNNKFRLIAIGASTGGTEAIKDVLLSFPELMPPIVVVQHMPAGFTASYARRLDNLMPLKVIEFNQPYQELQNGHVYIANGANHMVVQQRGGKLFSVLNEDAPVNRHKPAVDVLFSSVAEEVGSASLGVLLTGMGVDGAKGLGDMHSAGAVTVAQDQKSSVVWGMPRVAIENGAADEVLSLGKIGQFLVERCYR